MKLKPEKGDFSSMKKLNIAAVMAAVLLATPLAAKPVTITLGIPSPPKAHLNVQIFAPWAKRVSAQSDGTMFVRHMPGGLLVKGRNVYERVTKRVADIGWNITLVVRGKFIRTGVGALPFEVETGEVASVALWRLYKKGILGDEYGEVKPLGLIALPQSSIHTKVPIMKVEDMKGLKFRAAGKVGSTIITVLGGAPIGMPVSEAYQAMSRGVINGILTPWTAFQPFKLWEVTSNHLDGQFGAFPSMFIMNKESYASLPVKARRAIDQNSGEKFSRDFGAFWDRVQTQGRAKVKAMKGHTIRTLNPEQTKRWGAKLRQIADNWAKGVPGGDKVLKAFREEIARVKAGK